MSESNVLYYVVNICFVVTSLFSLFFANLIPHNSKLLFFLFSKQSTKPNIVERSVTWAEPRITVIPPSTSGSRSVLMAMHSEYTRYNYQFLIIR